MIGDLTNFLGAVKQHLLQTMVILSIYHTLCDLVLLLQIFYYRRYHQNAALRLQDDDEDEQRSRIVPQTSRTLAVALEAASSREPLPASETTPLVNSSGPQVVQVTATRKCTPSSTKTWISSSLTYCSHGVPSFVAAYGLILVVGVVGWSISQHGTPTHHDPANLPPTPPTVTETWDLSAQVMGWISAFCYISSRIPQIFKNQITKCHGLSLLFFLVGITGDLTYVASILVVDRSPEHILINLSWLIGSGATVFLDLIVLYQFWRYRHEPAAARSPNTPSSSPSAL